VDFRGKKRSNDTHASVTDPDARLRIKSAGTAAKLVHHGHVVTENRHGLMVAACVTIADGDAEERAALQMLGKKHRRGTIAADKWYDRRTFIDALRDRGLTPHVACNANSKRSSNLDGRTTRHPGYRVSQNRRKMIEEVFGWMKTVGLMRKLRHRGTKLVEWIFEFAAAAYNLVRMRKLIGDAPPLGG